MSAGAWFADVAALAAIAASSWTMLSGWRKRERDRAAALAIAPYTAGREVADEAQQVLALRAAALKEAHEQQQALRTQNADLQAQNKAQENQISELYTKCGRLTAENSELREGLRLAKGREEDDRTRINDLEAKVGELSKHLGLGQ